GSFLAPALGDTDELDTAPLAGLDIVVAVEPPIRTVQVGRHLSCLCQAFFHFFLTMILLSGERHNSEPQRRAVPLEGFQVYLLVGRSAVPPARVEYPDPLTASFIGYL